MQDEQSEAPAPASIKLRRREAPGYIFRKHGQKASYNTLCKLAVTGGGPPMHKLVNGEVFYTPPELDEWCRNRVLAGTYRSTAEMPAAFRRPRREREAGA